ncbi:3-oxoacyl-[acyl-carrier-protein] reductase FabG-like [Ostrinia nubilalis]|uniref:3-oxoacyl-[acyl-carrier-protein] reductase FabG-like n=1 Tax=Ostrinia nubilalis TaxID=29057 RepID=UPI0030822566
MSFKNKVVLVTGASSGIGAATAILFSKEGANVAIVGRNESKLKNVSEQCAAVGHAPLVIKADVADDDDARRIVNDTLQKFGKLDVLVNNAGIVQYGTLLNGKVLESFDKIIAINLRAVVHITMLAAPHLVKTKGNVVNVSSVAGQVHITPPFMAYCTSKAGLDHFTRGCALELSSSGVRVNAISPGPVTTDIVENSGSTAEFEEVGVTTPLGRVSESEEIADLILYVASDKSKGITGSVFVTDNGVMIKK